MPVITRELLRKRSEHNEGMISTLEEITLHQEELEGINEVLGMCCRKIKILYLQNNIIPKMENLFHLKDLEYLNLALNNIQKIEGLQNCEFIKKLDLTINFVDLDELKASMDHLSTRDKLVDLYMMGNPCQSNWDKFTSYVIAKLPQLNTLDGTEITRSMRITANHALPKLEAELEQLASRVRLDKAVKNASKSSDPVKNKKSSSGKGSSVVELAEGEDVSEGPVDEEEEEDSNEMTENTPEARIKIYAELAQQKKEKEERANVNAPKQRDYDKEQVQSVSEIRSKEAAISSIDESDLKQRNEGGWDFFWDEESRPGYVILDVHVAKHLDSSLIDVDVHPSYVSIVIKSKILRLRLPAEVKASESKCQRSKISGSLMVIMPKVNPGDNAVTIRGDIKARGGSSGDVKSMSTTAKSGLMGGDRNSRLNDHTVSKSTASQREKATANTILKPKKLSLHEQMMLDAQSNNSDNNDKSNSILLDSVIGSNTNSSSSSGINSSELHNIIRKPRGSTNASSSDLFELETVFQASNKVTELD